MFTIRNHRFAIGTIALALLCLTQAYAQTSGPKYQIDPFWAKFPSNWVIGPLGGTCVDARDHVWVLHRQEGVDEEMLNPRDRFDGAAKKFVKAPPVVELDPQGNVVNSWGDAKALGNYLHDCFVDKESNVWIAPARSGYVQKYSREGKLLMQIGRSGVVDSSDGTVKGKPLNSNSAQFFGPSAVDVDPQNGDVYVADGHGGGNTRIAVLDKNGKFLRQWTLHRSESEKIEVLPHCMRLSADGQVYVCDRIANRLQAYDKMGNFKRNIELPWKNYTPENEDLRKYCHTVWRTFPPCLLVQKIGRGTSAVSVEFSRDSNQKYIYVANQNQREIDVLDRVTGKVVSTIGHGPGLFYDGQIFDAIRAAVDSKGNVYVAEDEGRRLQKFKIVGQ